MRRSTLALILLVLLMAVPCAWADEQPPAGTEPPVTGSKEAPARKEAPASKEAPGKKEAPGEEGVRQARHERGEMTADRPELSVSSRTVGTGRAQLEVEVEYEQETRDGETLTRVVAPNALLRLGVSRNLEVRVASSILVIEGGDSGTANAAVGVKWNFHPGEPSLGVLAQATMPAGHPKFRVEKTQYQVAFLADFPLAKGLEARVNVGASSAGSVEGKRIDPTGSMAVFTKLGKSVELHVEYGYLGASRFRGGTAQVADVGVALIVDEDTQVDLAGFKGIAGEAYDFKVVVGFGHRF